MTIDREVAQENRRWLEGLAPTSPTREAECGRLYALMLRVARGEVLRRAPSLRMFGPELEDIAHQAAADALMSVSSRLHRFRGESRFTTWASKFVIFDVASKMSRHHWRHFDVAFDQEDWARLASRSDVAPEETAEVREFVRTIETAVEQGLTERQRLVFLAVVMHGTPIAALAERLGTTHNALYKVLFDARKKLRAALAEAGHLQESQAG